MEPSSPYSDLNVDPKSVVHFGEEWTAFRQDRGWTPKRLRQDFDAYFSPLPEGVLTPTAVAADYGAGSGRWAAFVAPRVRHLYVVEPSHPAMQVAKQHLSMQQNVTYLEEPIGGSLVPDETLDLAYSIGVLHCVPNPAAAMEALRKKLKPGGYLLVYLYYALENRPGWYRAVWAATNVLRRRISRLHPSAKRAATSTIAVAVYWPLARAALILARFGVPVRHLPLSFYATKSLYAMRNDALDRFGTPLERRYTRSDITAMVSEAGYDVKSLRFSDSEPYWCFSVANHA
ncbi:MAG: class I SAM-dependent methyltransferase [Jatrophihabitans sp.]